MFLYEGARWKSSVVNLAFFHSTNISEFHLVLFQFATIFLNYISGHVKITALSPINAFCYVKISLCWRTSLQTFIDQQS